ncbi:WD40-repeat-containing domain protein [Zopfochytrium polystomum]|nr:WD40-repeat-containing domain protein [Zopfochytrium polystomum]
MPDPFFVNKKGAGARTMAKPKAKTNPTARSQKTGSSTASSFTRQPKRKRFSGSKNSGDGDGDGSAKQRGSGRFRGKNEELGDGRGDDATGFGAVEDLDLEADDGDAVGGGADDDELEDVRETAAHKRLRLAKKYLDKIAEKTELLPGEFDAADIDRDLIAERLREDVLEAKGKLFRKVAKDLEDVDWADPRRIRTFKANKKPHQGAVTSVGVAVVPAATSSTGFPEVYIYSGSKDAAIVKWDMWTGKAVHVIPGGIKRTKKALKAYGEKNVKQHIGHHDQILCLAASFDGQYIATGGRDKAIHIWSVADNKHLGVFTQHRDAVAGLAFRQGGSNQLFSCSYDRTVKVWNVDEMSYVETLFGHQDQIISVDALQQERCLTAGARDKTVRLWKLVEESQLIFRFSGGGSSSSSSAAGAADIPDDEAKGGEEATASRKDGGRRQEVKGGAGAGTDGGAISLWNTQRKKPIFTRLRAHGPTADAAAADATPFDGTCRWIVALSALKYADVFASGACDGAVRLWRLAADKKSFSALGQVAVDGFVNALAFFWAPPERVVAEAAKRGEAESADVAGASEEAVVQTKGAARRAAARAAMLRAGSMAPDVLYLAVGTGKEHRSGRWWSEKGAKNTVHVISLAAQL